MVTDIYLVRHAQSEGNVEKFFQGRTDTSVTYKGFCQLRFLSERFKNIKIDKLYSSPLLRTRQTADAVNRYHGLSLNKENNLAEIDGGDFEGVLWSDLDIRFPNEMNMWRNNLPEFSAPHGESIKDVYKRMSNSISKIAENNKGKSIAIVSHGCAIKNFLCFVEFENVQNINDTGWADNTSVSHILYNNGSFKIDFKNDSSHLPENLCTTASALWSK